jgi:hypothetical protein
MAISSVSRTYVAPDPVMETDLELLAKINTYQQTKFDAGSQALQQEVNNWSMMTQIAKPELRQYANEKLVNLVNGIKGLGGVKLSDPNNVNSLKALGYNIYGDQRIMDGIGTTMRMKALSADAQAKLSGKDAGKYDNTVSNYLMKGYQDWANDGDVENARYDGPTTLPMGNMNTINEKVQKYLKELKPDSDSAPSGDLQKSYGYFQVDGKWLKGNRIQEAIDAVVDQNDALIFRAHGWSALNNNSDAELKSKLGLVYDNTSASIKSTINDLQTRLNNASDAATKLNLTTLIAQQKQALANNEQEKNQWFSKPQLGKEEREGIQESLFKNAWKSNVTNSYAYNQQKIDYKANMPLIFHDRMQIQAQQWAKDYELRVADYELRKLKTEAEIGKMNFGFGGGSGLPYTQVPITDDANQQKNPVKMIDQFNSDYFNANYKYYSHLYNMLGAHDSKQRFENKNGEWIPKKEYTAQIDKEVADLVNKLDNYSNLSESERLEVDKLLPTDPTELKSLFAYKSQITSLKAFSKIAQNKETEIINAGIAKGTIPFDWRGIKVRVTNKEGKSKDYPIQDLFALTTGPNAIYDDEATITGIPGATYPKGFKMQGAKGFKSDGWTPDIPDIFNVKTLKSYVNNLRTKAEDEYVKVGGKMFNSYSVPIPFTTLGKPQQEIIQKQLASQVNTEDVSSINPINGRIEYDFKTNTPRYKVAVEYKKIKGDTNKGPVEIDVTDMINQGGGGFGIHSAFPTSDISHVWGLTLASDGATPFVKTDNYRDAVRTTNDNYPFQVASVPNSLNGTVGARVKIALPIGNGETVEVNVKNFQNGSLLFPPDVDMVKRYLDTVLGTPEKKARFYKEHGLEIPK